MSATATPATSDRSDFRTVMVGGTEIGLITAAGVVAFLVVSRQVTAVLPQQLLEALIVLATGVAVSFLPGRMTAARHGERSEERRVGKECGARVAADSERG